MLLKCLNIEPQDAPGLPYSALAGMLVLCCYYYLQPLGDVMALRMGIEYTPLVTVGNIVLITVANPLYGLAARLLPVPQRIPAIYRTLLVLLLLFSAAMLVWPESRPISFAFAVFLGSFSLFLMTTYWARMASLHSRAEAKRVYGIIASGAQAGQLVASATAALLFDHLSYGIIVVSAALLEAAVQALRLRGERSESGAGRNDEREIKERNTNTVDGGGCLAEARRTSCAGVTLLASTPLLRAITLHTLGYTLLVAGVWYERAAAVAVAFSGEEERYDFFAMLNALVGGATLLVQLLLFSHLLNALGFHRTLLIEPAAIGVGLVLAVVRPGLLSIAVLDGLRKVAHYAVGKPTKEGLYAALPADVQFVAKPLLDTLVYRVGSLGGAAYFSACVTWGVSPQQRQAMLLGLTILWAAVSWRVGVIAESEQAAHEVHGTRTQLL